METKDPGSSPPVLPEDLQQAIQEFATALSEQPAFRAWEEAAWALRRDETAQSLYQQLAALDRQLRPLVRMGAADPASRQQLEKLQRTYLELPAVAACGQAEVELRSLCQETNAALAAAAGLDLTAWCGGGCCG